MSRRPRTDRHGKPIVPSMHKTALRYPWYWERLRWLRKWTVNWSRTYVRFEGPMTLAQTLMVEGPGFGSKPNDRDPMWHRAPEDRQEVNGLALAEAVSSEDVHTGKHHILIDIDRMAVLLPSSTEGHHHLYVQMGTMGDGLAWEDYAEWLRASAKIGLIEQGYAEVSMERKATFVRLPWIRKGHEREDRERALGWWIEQPEGVGLDGRAMADSQPPL